MTLTDADLEAIERRLVEGVHSIAEAHAVFAELRRLRALVDLIQKHGEPLDALDGRCIWCHVVIREYVCFCGAAYRFTAIERESGT